MDLQEQDTRLTQLAHRAATLPDAAALKEAHVRLARLRDETVAAETIAGDLEREQDKAEADVQQVRDRIARDRALIEAGGDARQVQALQSELDSLARRQSDLEDVELEVMDRVEGARAAVALLSADRDAVDAECAALAASVSAQMADIDSEKGQVVAERERIASAIPADLLGLYEKIRADHGGLGAAPLHRGRCEGCRLQLPPNEIETIRAAAANVVLRCEECRRILVRTAESGL